MDRISSRGGFTLEEDFSAVHSPGRSVSSEISHSFPRSFRLDATVARRDFIRRHSKSKQTAVQYMDACDDSPSLQDALTGQQFVFENICL